MRHDQNRRHLLSALTLAPLACVPGAAAAQPTLPPLVQPAEPTRAAFFARARELRDQAVREGDQAYGAVVVRDAARRLGTRDLSQCDVYSTAIPCAMCQGALYWGRIRRVFTEHGAVEGLAPKLGC